MRVGRRALIRALGLFVVAMGGSVMLVEAHAVLVKSVPASRAALSHAPDRVELWFNERLEPAFSTVSVWNAAGTQVDRRDAVVGPDDARRLSVAVEVLAPGAYTVRFRVLSVDGHIVESSFSFSVNAAP
jgi:methionine-rich copper-binding protein CopC